MMFSLTPTRFDCPECQMTGKQNQEICPVCYGAKWVDISTTQDWVLEQMELWGCDSVEINNLRTEKPDFLTLGFCLEVLKILHQSQVDSDTEIN